MNYANDRRLDFLILGSMGPAGGTAPTAEIQRAVLSLLQEPDLAALITRSGVLEKNIHVPVGQSQSEIVENIFSLLDTADLVLVDLTPREEGADRANVFYELGLVHALGIPCILLVREGTKVPFYATTSKQCRFPDYSIGALTEILRDDIREFLDWENRTATFTNSRISQFYRGLSIVDISAANGLATGYYYNFLSRLITEGGYLSLCPKLIRHVLYVRPSSVGSTYEADFDALQDALESEGLVLKEEKQPPIPSDDKGMLWFYHVEGIVLDVPRMIYPLRRSPRLLALKERHSSFPSPAAERAFLQRLAQVQDALLDRVESTLRFQVRHDGTRVRESILRYTTIAEAPGLVKKLLS